MKLKTSVQIDGNLLTEIKNKAIEYDTSISTIVNIALNKWIREEKQNEIDEKNLIEIMKYLNKNKNNDKLRNFKYIIENYTETSARIIDIIYRLIYE